MKRTLASLQSAFATPERKSRPSNYYPFFLMKVDQQSRVRFIPDKNEENPMGFLVEKVVHNLIVNGNKVKTPCLSMYGDDCPICATSQQYYKAGDEDNGKKFWKKKEHLGQVLVLEDPLPPDSETGETHEGKVRFINLGFQLFGIIKNAFESGDLDEVPFNFQNGYDFIIKKTAQGEWGTYALGSNFARRSTALDDDVIAMIEEEMVDLSTLLPAHPGLEKTEGLLNAALTGEEYQESSTGNKSFAKTVQSKMKKETTSEDSDDAPFEPDPEPEVKKTSTKAKSTPAVTEEDELDANAEDIIAKIRSRRKKKA